MPDIVHVTYAQTGASSKTNAFGMREMQAKAYQERDAQYLLLKAPPASGKSRALMFIALDKLIHQGLKKVIVAVPEKSIGATQGRKPNLNTNDPSERRLAEVLIYIKDQKRKKANGQ